MAKAANASAMTPAPIRPAPALAIIDPVIRGPLASQARRYHRWAAKKDAAAVSPRASVAFAVKSGFRLQPKRGARGGPDLPAPGPPGPPGPVGFGFIGRSPSRCNFLRASLRARRIASAFSLAFFSDGFS